MVSDLGWKYIWQFEIFGFGKLDDRGAFCIRFLDGENIGVMCGVGHKGEGDPT